METTLAQLVQDTMRIREESFDQEGCEAASAAAEARKKAEPDNMYAGMVAYSQFYKLSMQMAARAACKQAGDEFLPLEQPVYLLCECAWNDAQQWAQEVLAKEQQS